MMRPCVHGWSGTPWKTSATVEIFFECTRRFVAARVSLLPSFAEAVHETMTWYRENHATDAPGLAHAVTRRQIEAYSQRAVALGAPWAT
jgi:hypothetical protein